MSVNLHSYHLHLPLQRSKEFRICKYLKTSLYKPILGTALPFAPAGPALAIDADVLVAGIENMALL